MSCIEMTLKSTNDWKSKDMASRFADVLVSEGEFFVPEKFDRGEPERYSFDPKDLTKFVEFWRSPVVGFGTKRKKPYPTWMLVDIWYRESEQFNEILSGFDERYFSKEENIAKLLSCAKYLYDWGAITHGYICHCDDWELKNRFGRLVEDAKGRVVAGGGTRLEEGLPGIYWANFFGPIYVEFFGRDKFLTVPAYHKEELPDGGFLLVTSPSPLEYGQQKVQRLEKRIINHLGREAFFEKAHPKKVCRAPKFTFEQASLGRPIEVVAYDPVSEAIPYADRFIREAPQLAEALVKRFAEKIDYSPESLEQVDDFILKKSYRRPEPWAKEKWRRLLQELTAYYGEVLRRNLHGKWVIREGSGGAPHPIVVFTAKKQEQDECPFTRVIKLWSGRERADGLSVRYYLLHSGELRKAERFLMSLFAK